MLKKMKIFVISRHFNLFSTGFIETFKGENKDELVTMCGHLLIQYLIFAVSI